MLQLITALRPMYMQATIHFAQTYPPQHPGGYVDQHYHQQPSTGQPPMYAGHHPPPPPAYNGAPPPSLFENFIMFYFLNSLIFSIKIYNFGKKLNVKN